jgi:hypothetical protein
VDSRKAPRFFQPQALSSILGDVFE